MPLFVLDATASMTRVCVVESSIKIIVAQTTITTCALR